MQQAGFHHAKILATRLPTTIDTQGTEILAMLQELVVTDNNPPIEEALPPPPHAAPPDPAVNATARTDVQLETLYILQEMQQNNAS